MKEGHYIKECNIGDTILYRRKYTDDLMVGKVFRKEKFLCEHKYEVCFKGPKTGNKFIDDVDINQIYKIIKCA